MGLGTFFGVVRDGKYGLKRSVKGGFLLNTGCGMRYVVAVTILNF